MHLPHDDDNRVPVHATEGAPTSTEAVYDGVRQQYPVATDLEADKDPSTVYFDAVHVSEGE